MSRPGVLEKYLSPSIAKEVSGLFTGLYTLDKVNKIHLVKSAPNEKKFLGRGR